MPLLFVRLMENPPGHNFIPKNYFLQTFPQVARICRDLRISEQSTQVNFCR
jgi:hypothetical protein